jgi:hypothetical protein
MQCAAVTPLRSSWLKSGLKQSWNATHAACVRDEVPRAGVYDESLSLDQFAGARD